MIGVFDSGLGGLTALISLRELMPKADLLYFGDTGRVPYGNRSDDIIIKYTRQDFKLLLDRGVQAILAACGTVSSVALPVISGDYEKPLIGVLSAAASAAAKATRNGVIGVIATNATIASGAYERELKAINADFRVISNACPLLVPLVEGGYIKRDCQITRLALADYLTPIRESGADTLILGCTHYPIIAPIIADMLPGVTLINSGREAAKEIAVKLTGENHGGGTTEILVSDSPQNFESVARIFLGRKLDAKITKVDIEQ